MILPPKFGISTISFKEKVIQEALPLLKKTGLSYVDLAIILPDFCPHYNPLITSTENDINLFALFNENDLKVSSLNVVPGYFNYGYVENTKKFLLRCFQIANKLETKIITIPSGVKKPVAEWEASVCKIKPYLNEMIRQARDFDIVLSVEAPHLGTLVETPEQAKRFFEILDEPDIKCTFDTSHVRRTEKHQLTEAAKLIGHHIINHIHLRDAFRETIKITPGKGTSDFRDFFQYLKSVEYGGYLIHELEFHGFSSKKILDELEFSINYCNRTYNNERIKGLNYNPVYNSFNRFLSNPKVELKNFPQTLNKLKKISGLIHRFIPEKVYEGKYIPKIRFNKSHIARFRRNSITIDNPDNRKIKVGIIGLGTVGLKWHAEGFYRLKNIDLIGGYDINEERNTLFSEKYNVGVCHDLQELIDRRPNIVAICTREWDHYDIAKKLLENGIDIFCEKIFTSRIKQAEELVNIANNTNRSIGVNYNYRYMPGILKIKELIANKTLGRLSYFIINTNALSYAHALDLLTFFGGKIISVTGTLTEDYYKRMKVFDWSLFDDDIQYIPSKATTVTVVFEDNCIGVINSSVDYELKKIVVSVEAAFEKAVVTLNGVNIFNSLGIITHSSDKKIKNLDLNIRKNVYTKEFGYTFYESIKDFVECYIKDKPLPTDGKQAMFNMQLEKIIAKSSIEGIRINL